MSLSYAKQAFDRSVAKLAAGIPMAPQEIKVGASAAVGKLLFSTNFAAGDTLNVNEIEFTFKPAAAAAVGKIVFTGNLIAGDTVRVNDRTFTCKASGAAGEYEFNVAGTLSLSLDALVTCLNASDDATVAWATYSKTDANTALTATSDTNNPAHNNYFLGTTHATAVVTQPTGGVAAAGTLEIDLGASLSATLDAIVTKLNASGDTAISWATYSKTDTNTSLTATADTNNTAHNGRTFRTSHTPVTVTPIAGGMSTPAVSLEHEVTVFNQVAGNTFTVTLPDGVEGQRKSIVNLGAGTINLTSSNYGTGTNHAFNGVDVETLVWLGGKWRVVHTTGVTVT